MSSPNISITSAGLPQLANALAQSGSGIAAQMEPVVRHDIREVRDLARAYAARTARKHGKRYPASITDDVMMQDGGIYGEAGPDTDKAQGGMSFEYGSAHQPPHLDIERAGRVYEDTFTGHVETAVDMLLRQHGL